MIGARIKARKVLTENQERETALPLLEIQENVSIEEWYSVSLVITFLEKYGVLLKTGQLDQPLAKELLGRDFEYWYNRFLHNMISEDRDDESYWATALNYAHHWLKS